MITDSTELDALLEPWREALGNDYHPYRNHLLRLLNLVCERIQPDAGIWRDLVVAAAFHDLGIWSDRTLDYLEPSRRRALSETAAGGLEINERRVSDLILWHHKITAFRGPEAALINAFRRADWYEVCCGLFGRWSWRAERRALYRRIPLLGFHRVLLRVGLRRLRTHPLSPLPILRW